MKEKKKNGRPNKYYTNVQPKLGVIKGWARDGLTDEDIASNLDIALSSFYDYKREFSEFSESLKRGKEEIDTQVENSLLKRALGYDYEEVTKELSPITGLMQETKRVTKQVVPDTTAQIFWLKNRLPEKWRDKADLNLGSTDSNLEAIEINFVNKAKKSTNNNADPKIIGDYTKAIDKSG